MPEISRFYGIIVRMFTDDHAPPHFHAFYNEFEILMDIEDFRILAGNFPPKSNTWKRIGQFYYILGLGLQLREVNSFITSSCWS